MVKLLTFSLIVYEVFLTLGETRHAFDKLNEDIYFFYNFVTMQSAKLDTVFCKTKETKNMDRWMLKH